MFPPLATRPAPVRALPLLLLTVLGGLGAAFTGGCGNDNPTGGTPALRVPQDYPYPQAAVDAAEPGEVVVVQPGVYPHVEVRDVDSTGHPGGVRAALFMRDDVRVLGLGDPGTAILMDTTAVDSTGIRTTVGIVFAGNSNTARAENVAVEGFGTGALIRERNGYLLNCRVSGCNVGVDVDVADQPLIVGSLIEDCAGPGIRTGDAGSGLGANAVRRCDVGIEAVRTGQPYLESNAVCRNRVGLRVAQGATPILRYNVALYNTRSGVLLESGAVPDLTQNDLYGNAVDLEVRAYDPPLEQPLPAEGNWWGDTDVEDIGTNRIRDANGDPSRGAVVDFVPVSPISFFPLYASLGNICGSASGSPEAMRLLRGLGRGLTLPDRP